MARFLHAGSTQALPVLLDESPVLLLSTALVLTALLLSFLWQPGGLLVPPVPSGHLTGEAQHLFEGCCGDLNGCSSGTSEGGITLLTLFVAGALTKGAAKLLTSHQVIWMTAA
mmetsp:Transcript_57098/g.133125  ORF Transcript_57098/g.133125 Transcript_57098/m.133125 type:complete len:113 (+) Transcript_57098:89-427(+)